MYYAKDALAVLGIKPPQPEAHWTEADCTAAVAEWKSTTLKKAWKAKIRKAHPDTGGDPAEFQRVQKAYEYLRDAVLRLKFNVRGKESEKAPTPEAKKTAAGSAALIRAPTRTTALPAGLPVNTTSTSFAEPALRSGVGSPAGALRAIATTAEPLIETT